MKCMVECVRTVVDGHGTPTSEADSASAEGSSAGAKAALVIGILAALSGAFGLVASQVGDQLRGLLPALFLELAQR